jgi:BASS family bile acid:Na+ symporter
MMKSFNSLVLALWLVLLCMLDVGHAFVPRCVPSLSSSSSLAPLSPKTIRQQHDPPSLPRHQSTELTLTGFPAASPSSSSLLLLLSVRYSTSKDNIESSSTADNYNNDNNNNNNKMNRLDDILSTLTSAFPFFVLGAATLALFNPSLLLWTNKGDSITLMLASVMWGTGLTLTKEDFSNCLQQDFAAVPAGVLCQFIIMPLTAYIIGKTLLLSSSLPQKNALYLGLCLVGCSPGGTASNLVSLIAQADVALSVLLTSCSTILASVVTPLLVKALVGSAIAVSGWALCIATARVVLLPVLLGMVVNANAPNLAKAVSRFTPFCSVILVSLICGGVVAENSSLFLSKTTAGLVPLLITSVFGLHCVGFLAGYLVPRWGLHFNERTSRTISIETGMQNSALAVVLARSIGAPAIASLPGALSATVHSCLGSILAAYWRGVDASRLKNNGTTIPPSNESPDDYPELVI